jgi:hypothetical protein
MCQPNVAQVELVQQHITLCLHTDTTLQMFNTVADALCQVLRHFVTVICPRYATKELLCEVNARVTCRQAQVKNSTRERKTICKSVKLKHFNMVTYKMHCIPDYPDAIQRYRTTDSYSMQTVSTLYTGSTAALTNTERTCALSLEDVVQDDQQKSQFCWPDRQQIKLYLLLHDHAQGIDQGTAQGSTHNQHNTTKAKARGQTCANQYR